MNTNFYTNYSDITFLNKIKNALTQCTSFYFSVSFIKKAGLVLILPELESSLRRGVTGKIITSTYQNFTDIASLEIFLSLSKKYSNFECHLDFNSFGDNGFHSKGYLFEYNGSYEMVIGSTNITRFALLKNVEWNVSVSDKSKQESIIDAYNEFKYLWEKTFELTSDIIKNYMLALEYAIEKWDMDYIHSFTNNITPNYMQRNALKEIRRYRDMGVNKALVIAATGSGKTYLAAFDARNFDAKKLLFIVHRDTILKEALDTFSKVFGDKVTYGRYTGTIKELDRNFIFSTNTTMSKNLELFDRNEFDYIIIDEVHHITASTYKRIVEYFTPQFLLGLTATPERMDGKDVFELFEKNVPYELRLRDALLNNLIVPFKYYGIKDQLLDYSENDAKSLIQQISSDIHCEFVKEQIEKYRPIDKLKAIGFCRSIEHARIMSEKMNELGYTTTFLIGKNDTGERLKAFKDLQDDLNQLEIIFTVDLLNEGVDIPKVNMVLFLRPTDSSTIFIQQLGRGLRKCEGKEYLTVLDFIGNSYKRSVQIALAIGTLSENPNTDKKLLASYIQDDFQSLDLPIEIHIDELSKEEILKSIESTNFNSLEFLKQDYFNFKKYLNIEQPPKHIDFINSECATDLLRFVKVYNCYYNFLLKVKEDTPLFSEEQVKFLEYLSSFIPLIRPYEFLIIKSLLTKEKTETELIDDISDTNNFNYNKFKHALNHLQNLYYSKKEQELKNKYINEDNNIYWLDISLDNEAYLEHINDLLDYGLERYDNEFEDFSKDLKLYANYSRIQFLLAIQNHTMTFREGLKWDNGKLYIFIDLKKDENKDEWLLYNDEFKSSSLLQWESSTNTTLDNVTGKKLIAQRFVHVFVRKIKREDGISLPYIYLGKGELTNPRHSNNVKLSLLFDIKLENNIPHYLQYEFQINNK